MKIISDDYAHKPYQIPYRKLVLQVGNDIKEFYVDDGIYQYDQQKVIDYLVQSRFNVRQEEYC